MWISLGFFSVGPPVSYQGLSLLQDIKGLNYLLPILLGCSCIANSLLIPMLQAYTKLSNFVDKPANWIKFHQIPSFTYVLVDQTKCKEGLVDWSNNSKESSKWCRMHSYLDSLWLTCLEGRQHKRRGAWTDTTFKSASCIASRNLVLNSFDTKKWSKWSRARHLSYLTIWNLFQMDEDQSTWD